MHIRSKHLPIHATVSAEHGSFANPLTEQKQGKPGLCPNPLSCVGIATHARLMKIALILASLLGATGFAPMRTTVLAMQADPAATRDASPPKAPKSGFTLTLAGGQRTMEDVRKAQRKAAKSMDIYAKTAPELDLKRTESGWNKMNRN